MATSFATNSISSVVYPVIQVELGTTSAATAPLDGTAARGAYVDQRSLVVVVSATPTITAGAYTAGKAVGGLLTFSNAARASGKPIEIVGARILDKAANTTANSVYELYLFDRTFTASADAATFTPSDSDAANGYEVLAFAATDAYVTGANTWNRWSNARRPIILPNGTDLFGQLVTRTTPTYGATSDIVVSLHIRQL